MKGLAVFEVFKLQDVEKLIFFGKINCIRNDGDVKYSWKFGRIPKQAQIKPPEFIIYITFQSHVQTFRIPPLANYR